MPTNFSYRFPKGVAQTTRWEVSLVLETEDETLTLAVDFRHSIVALNDKEILWTLKELGRRGPEVALPPYLSPGKSEIPVNRKGVPAPGYAIPCFLLPAFPDQTLEENSERMVRDKSSGIEMNHVFTVLEDKLGTLRVVGDAAHESDDLEVEIGGDYLFHPTRGQLYQAKIVIDSFRPGLTRNLAIQIFSH